MKYTQKVSQRDPNQKVGFRAAQLQKPCLQLTGLASDTTTHLHKHQQHQYQHHHTTNRKMIHRIRNTNIYIYIYIMSRKLNARYLNINERLLAYRKIERM